MTAHTRSALKVVLMVEIVPRFFATLTGIWELSLVHSRASVMPFEVSSAFMKSLKAILAA